MDDSRVSHLRLPLRGGPYRSMGCDATSTPKRQTFAFYQKILTNPRQQEFRCSRPCYPVNEKAATRSGNSIRSSVRRQCGLHVDEDQSRCAPPRRTNPTLADAGGTDDEQVGGHRSRCHSSGVMEGAALLASFCSSAVEFFNLRSKQFELLTNMGGPDRSNVARCACGCSIAGKLKRRFDTCLGDFPQGSTQVAGVLREGRGSVLYVRRGAIARIVWLHRHHRYRRTDAEYAPLRNVTNDHKASRAKVFAAGGQSRGVGDPRRPPSGARRRKVLGGLSSAAAVNRSAIGASLQFWV